MCQTQSSLSQKDQSGWAKGESNVIKKLIGWKIKSSQWYLKHNSILWLHPIFFLKNMICPKCMAHKAYFVFLFSIKPIVKQAIFLKDETSRSRGDLPSKRESDENKYVFVKEGTVEISL